MYRKLKIRKISCGGKCPDCLGLYECNLIYPYILRHIYRLYKSITRYKYSKFIYNIKLLILSFGRSKRIRNIKFFIEYRKILKGLKTNNI